MLAVATMVIAGATKLPELALSQQESEAVSAAGVALLDHYGIGGVSREVQLWGNLAMVTGGIAYNRFGMYAERKHNERLAKSV